MVKTIYWLQCLRHSICILITKLHLQLVELSKTANINSQYLSTVSSYMWIAKKNMFPQNTIETIAHPQSKKGKKDTWSQVTIHKKWVPVSEVKRLVFSVRKNTQFALWTRLHVTPVICILPAAVQKEKISGPEILGIRKSCLSDHGNWRWSRQCSLINSGNFNNHREFDHRMCG